ncbi:hypothetical protein GMORB2_4284 [Geosmithia morbida]|uniref:F-box domain-containing protein n=1 Tax=Geosmithia morbida TaxID=1094350 RepID=A0A9P4Z2H9_9HYPO|nr:uncharacterized protein GMORB2_4284 [Geosmithia morbida]KAF4125444.1 hypothetical protein GMORB2_4284 [Geosmithia morbida]
MQMDTLPPAVIDRLCDAIADVSGGDLTQYASVSRSWQRVIERRTFHSLYLSSARLDDLPSVVTGPRIGYVRVITLHVALASYHRRQRNDMESAEDGSRSTHVFDSSIQDLFGTLAQWEDDVTSEGIHLEILVESPSDDMSGTSHTHARRRSRSPTTTRRARSSVTRLDLPRSALPRASVISALTCSGRHIELSSVLFLISKMPRLQLLDTEIEHDTAGERDLAQRRDFILGLQHCAPNITEFRLRRPMSTFDSPRSSSKWARSLFYSSLLEYTQQCITLKFDDSIDARSLLAYFRDDESGRRRYNDRSAGAGGAGSSSAGPWWPRLERLQVRNSYMMRRPYTRVRTHASAIKHVHDVVLFVGRALRCMPAAKSIRIRQYILAEGNLEHAVVKYDIDDAGRPVVVFQGLQPPQKTVDAWTASVLETRGVDLNVRILANAEGLANRPDQRF